MNDNSFADFTNKYSLSKTLKFELIPQRETREHIETKGILRDDEIRAEKYKKVKVIMNAYHKWFIDKALEGLELSKIDSFAEIYLKDVKENDADRDKNRKALVAIASDLRKQVAEAFFENKDESVNGIYKILFTKDLIKKNLKDFANEEDRPLIEEFARFTTYFTGYHTAKKNMYTHKKKKNSIAFRIVHENLPFFINNLRNYRFIKENYHNLDFSPIDVELKEVLQGTTLDEVFTLQFFNKTLTQKGIDSYNTLLGGKTDDKRDQIKGINQYINLYCQTEKVKIPRLKQLYKQILSDSHSASFLPEAFERDHDVLDSIKSFYSDELCNWKESGSNKNVFTEISDLLSRMGTFDLSKIFIKNDASLSGISQKMFGDWGLIKKALQVLFESQYPVKLTAAYEKKREAWVTKRSHFSINEIQSALELYKTQNKELEDKITANPLYLFFGRLMGQTSGGQKPNLLQVINVRYEQIKDLLASPYPAKTALGQEKTDVDKIKNFLDSLMDLLHFIKPLNLDDDDSREKDELFYGEYLSLLEQLDMLIPLYNKTRDYLTKRPYSEEKIKLNFDNSMLLDGWDVNEEPKKASVVLRKNGLYYLGIMDKSSRKVFTDIPPVVEGEAVYEKMVYKLLPTPNKMLPKVVFSEKNKDTFNPPEDICRIRNHATHSTYGTPQEGFSKGEFNLDDCHKLIDFYKGAINIQKDWKNYGFRFTDTPLYKNFDEFCVEVEQQGYGITFQDVPELYINKKIADGELYLFQIYNKDFSPFSKGKPNLHTIYWKLLFDENNLRDVVYKLNGKAEIFFRKKSLNYTEEKLKTGHHAEKLKDKFSYPIVSNRRFAYDKFQFHVPIALNFKASEKDNINDDVFAYLKNNHDVNIIGINRGERNLIYITLIDQQGNIKRQFSLNEIINNYNGKTYKTDYHAKLDAKEDKRAEARASWGVIENIKELKTGYLSQVVHQLTRLMVESNAIVVMEDLDSDFKRGRQKIEKQIYQKFEKMFIDKLNYLVFKDKENGAPGGALNALQLSNRFESFQKLYNQSGFLFYVFPAYISNIDPATGFVDFLRPVYENVEKAREFFGKFESIRFNKERKWFEFAFDYKNFTVKTEDTRTKWTVCTTPETRYLRLPGKGGVEECYVTELLASLFIKAGISCLDGSDLKAAILNQGSPQFFKDIIKLLAVTLLLRHNNGKAGAEGKDLLISPVANEKGEFFHSDRAVASQPQSAEANGAYHIALKGLWILRQINSADDFKQVNFAMSNKEWFQFVQGKLYKK